MKAFHIDRLGSLKAGQVLGLSDIPITPIEAKRILDERYPAGLTMHGSRYFASSIPKSNEGSYRSQLIENIFEYERQLHFPHLPSRFQAIFATETIEECKHWIDLLGCHNAVIWEIEYNSMPVKLDATYLTFDIENLSFISAAIFASLYWGGKASDSPLWELLIPAPVTVIRQI